MLYVDKHPYKNKQQLYDNNVAILSMRNLRLNKSMTPYEAIEFFLGWFEDIKQPSESQVRGALILCIREPHDTEYKYTLKAGGESASDSMFSASVSCLVMDENGEDKMVTFYTKYSHNFEDVLITPNEVYEAVVNNMSGAETTRKEISEVESMPMAFFNTVRKNPNFVMGEKLGAKIRKHKEAFFKVVDRFTAKLAEDFETYSSVEAYSSKYVTTGMSEEALKAKVEKGAECVRREYEILSMLIAQANDLCK
jgi:hypothetical protein